MKRVIEIVEYAKIPFQIFFKNICCLIPVNVLNLGKEEDIKRSVAECILKAHDSPKGYVLGSGCQVPLFTPAENVEAYLRWGKELGKLPIDTERLRRIAEGDGAAA